DRGQAVDLLVVRVLDVAASEELEDRAPDLDQVTVAQHVLVDRLVVDVGPVRRSEIAHQDRLPGVHDLRVIAGDRLLVDLDVALRRTANHHRRRVEVVFLPQLGTVITTRQASLPAGRSVIRLMLVTTVFARTWSDSEVSLGSRGWRATGSGEAG